MSSRILTACGIAVVSLPESVAAIKLGFLSPNSPASPNSPSKGPGQPLEESDRSFDSDYALAAAIASQEWENISEMAPALREDPGQTPQDHCDSLNDGPGDSDDEFKLNEQIAADVASQAWGNISEMAEPDPNCQTPKGGHGDDEGSFHQEKQIRNVVDEAWPDLFHRIHDSPPCPALRFALEGLRGLIRTRGANAGLKAVVKGLNYALDAVGRDLAALASRWGVSDPFQEPIHQEYTPLDQGPSHRVFAIKEMASAIDAPIMPLAIDVHNDIGGGPGHDMSRAHFEAQTLVTAAKIIGSGFLGHGPNLKTVVDLLDFLVASLNEAWGRGSAGEVDRSEDVTVAVNKWDFGHQCHEEPNWTLSESSGMSSTHFSGRELWPSSLDSQPGVLDSTCLPVHCLSPSGSPTAGSPTASWHRPSFGSPGRFEDGLSDIAPGSPHRLSHGGFGFNTLPFPSSSPGWGWQHGPDMGRPPLMPHSPRLSGAPGRSIHGGDRLEQSFVEDEWQPFGPGSEHPAAPPGEPPRLSGTGSTISEGSSTPSSIRASDVSSINGDNTGFESP